MSPVGARRTQEECGASKENEKPSTESFAQKVKISALWMFVGLNLTLVYTLEASVPGSGGLVHAYAGLATQQLSFLLLGDAATRLAPFVFAVLSLTLKDVPSRRLNLVLGIVFGFGSLVGLASLVTPPTVEITYSLVTRAAAIAGPFLVFLYAYRRPKGTILS